MHQIQNIQINNNELIFEFKNKATKNYVKVGYKGGEHISVTLIGGERKLIYLKSFLVSDEITPMKNFDEDSKEKIAQMLVDSLSFQKSFFTPESSPIFL